MAEGKDGNDFADNSLTSHARRTLWVVSFASYMVVLTCGALQAFGTRYVVGSDDISYLNISDWYLSGDIAGAANGYWSPAYPFLLAAIRWILRPSPDAEAASLHTLNFILYSTAFLAFIFFLRELTLLAKVRPKVDGRWTLTFCRPAEIVFATGLFLWGGLILNGVGSAGADLVVAIIVFALSAVLVRVQHNPKSTDFVILGFLLALGYMAKAVMFPIGLAIAIACGLEGDSYGLKAKRSALVLVTFLALSAPQLTAMSRIAGRMSYGDAGTLAYIGKVNGVTRWWVGMPPGSGVPEHPIKRIHVGPDVYAFGLNQANVSYPFWYAPAYWLRGIRPHFSFQQQAGAVRSSLLKYVHILGLLALSYLALRWLGNRSPRPRPTLVLIPPLLALGLYALVHVEPRFFSGWSVVLYLAAVAGLSFRNETRKKVYSILGLAMMALLAPLVRDSDFRLHQVAGALTGYASPNYSWDIAQALRRAGVHKGARVAHIGRAFEAYWARLAGVQISMEVNETDAPKFWASADSTKSEVLTLFRRQGASAVVFDNVPAGRTMPGLTPLGYGHFLIVFN